MPNSKLNLTVWTIAVLVSLSWFAGAGLLPHDDISKAHTARREAAIPEDMSPRRDEFGNDWHHPSSVWWSKTTGKQQVPLCGTCLRELEECKVELQDEGFTPAKAQGGILNAIWTSLFRRSVDTARELKGEAKHKILDTAEDLKEGAENILHGAERTFHHAKDRVIDATEHIKDDAEHLAHEVKDKVMEGVHKTREELHDVTNSLHSSMGLLLPLFVAFTMGLLLVMSLPSFRYIWLFPHGFPDAPIERPVLIRDELMAEKPLDDAVVAAKERHHLETRGRRRAH